MLYTITRINKNTNIVQKSIVQLNTQLAKSKQSNNAICAKKNY